MPPAIEPVATKAPLSELEQEGLDYRRRYQGLIGIGSKVPIRDRAILSLVYTPGVAEACLAINEDPLASFDLTCRGNTVAILTDGSDIFGRESCGKPADARAGTETGPEKSRRNGRASRSASANRPAPSTSAPTTRCMPDSVRHHREVRDFSMTSQVYQVYAIWTRLIWPVKGKGAFS